MTRNVTADAMQFMRLGDKIVRNYEKSPTVCKWPGGDCYKSTYARTREASIQVGDINPLMDYDKNFTEKKKEERSIFCALWGSHYYLPRWREIPDLYRGLGAPGAMAWDGRASKLLGARGIWAGELEPGAVLQVWKDFMDCIRVCNGEAPHSIGHSLFHHRYVYDGPAIIGMKVIDQGYYKDVTVKRGEWGFWVAANLRLRLPPGELTESPV